MARQRITPGSGLQPATGQTVGGTTDPFSPFTGRGARSRLDDLARALGGVGEESTGFYRRQRQRQKEEDAKAGKQAVLKAIEDQKNVADAIRQAKMRPGASKWFRWGVERQAGAYSANLARDHLVATRAEELEEATTLEEFDQIAGEAFDEYRETLGETTEAFDNGFMPTYMAQLEQQRYAFATQIDGKLTGEYVDNFQANQYETYNSAYAFGAAMLPSGVMGDDPTQTGVFEAMAAAATADLDAATRDNPAMAGELKDATVANLKSLAMRYQDPGFLDLAEEIKVGPEEQGENRTSLYAQYASGPDGLDQFRSTLNDLIYRRDTQEHIRRNRQIKEEREQTFIDILRIQAAGGMADPDTRASVDAMLRDMELRDPLGALQIRQSLKARQEAADTTVLDTYGRIRWGIIDGTAGLNDIRVSRDLLSQLDTERLISIYETERDKANDPAAQEILRLPAVTFWRGAIEDRFVNKIAPKLKDTHAAQRAQAMFHNRLLERQDEILALREENPNHPQLQQIYQQEANAASAEAAGSLGMRIGTTFAEDGTLVGGQDARPFSDEEIADRIPTSDLEKVWSWQAQGKLNSQEDPDVLRVREIWNSIRPDVEFGSTESLVIIRRILVEQRNNTGGSE